MTTELEARKKETSYRLWKEGGIWVADDKETGVASQGNTPQEAIENLGEAIEGHLRALEKVKKRHPPVPDAPWFE